MRTPKRLYAEERIIYHPELLTCLHCGDLLVMWNYLAWDKTVQTLDRLLSIATRPGRCSHATCPGSRMRLLSAEAQRLAPPGSTYGYDVLVRIGWLRQHQRATYSEMHSDLSARLAISEAHVRYLYQHLYLPLLACHERQQRGRLAQVAKEQGGLIIALDGLAPQGGEPQIWFIRDLSTGLTLRSGWLAQLDQPTFEAFLAPLKHLEWPILAVLSDKQTGLVPAVATVLPNSRHQFCQVHYLRNLAEPLAAADAAFKGELRKTVREQVGDVIRQEPRRQPGQAGVLTVTGLLPSPLEEPTAPACQSPAPSASPTASAPEADQVLTQLVRHTRYLLTLKGRPPFRLAGMETYERLHSVACLSLDLLAKRYEPRLAQLYQGLRAALSPFAETYHALHQGAAWLRDIAYILEPVPATPSALRASRGNSAAISTRYSGSRRAHRPERRLAVTSTRSAGAIGPACSTAMRYRGCRGPTTSWKATFAIRVAAYCGPPASRVKRSGRCNARAPGSSCPTPRQRPSYERPYVKPRWRI